MIKAHALYFTLVVSLIIALVSGALLLAAFYYGELHRQNLNTIRLINNLESGINLVLNSDEYNTPSTTQLDLFDKENDSLSISISPWGLFDKAEIISFKGKKNIPKSFLFGYKPTSTSPALYLPDYNRPLNICGNTELRGICYLPKSGVQRAYIGGKSYTGPQLVYGTIKTSANSLPSLNKDKLNAIENQLNTSTNSDSTFTINSGILEDTAFQYPIILKCNTHLLISNTCPLKNAIVIAPSITIESGFIGSVQLFAHDSITLEKKTTLEYPSSLVLLNSDTPARQIKIEDESNIQGVVLTVPNSNTKHQSLISIASNTLIVGQIYSSGYLDLKGEVHGNVYTNKFRLKTPASVYENHLLDAKIDSEKLPEYFVSTSLFETEDKKGIMSWVK